MKDFTGDIGATLLSLGKAIWPDFQLPAVDDVAADVETVIVPTCSFEHLGHDDRIDPQKE